MAKSLLLCKPWRRTQCLYMHNGLPPILARRSLRSQEGFDLTCLKTRQSAAHHARMQRSRCTFKYCATLLWLLINIKCLRYNAALSTRNLSAHIKLGLFTITIFIYIQLYSHVGGYWLSHTHTHTHTYIYIYCQIVCSFILNILY